MRCGSESLTTSSGSLASASKSEKEAAELTSLEKLSCHINHDKAPHAFLASEKLSDSLWLAQYSLIGPAARELIVAI